VRRYIFVIPIIFLGIGLFLSLWIIPKKTESNQILDKKEKMIKEDEFNNAITNSLPTITIKGITIKESDKVKGYDFVITANESNFNHLSSQIECYDILCNIFRNKNPIASVHAEKSFIDRLSKKILFGGPVKGAIKNLSFSGNDVFYNFSTQKVHTQKSITFSHPNFTFSANHSTVDINSQKIQMSKGVYSEILSDPTPNNSSK
jgi:hypothetical protein